MRYVTRCNPRRKVWEVSLAGSTVVLQAFDKLYQAERWVGSERLERQAEAS